VDLNGDDPSREFAVAVAEGLTSDPPWVPCRYLYDARGSELFESICEQPEYYLTRTEASILARRAGEIRKATGPVTLIELGSGTSVKTDYLLSAYANAGTPVDYHPVDVSEAALRIAADTIQRRHPTVRVSGIVSTYEQAFPLFREHSPSMVVFLGSTLGNFDDEDSRGFWSAVQENLEPCDFFLLGVDLHKDRETLEAAYNDRAGVTAEFTKNLFARMNRELGSEIDLDRLEHVAFYNEEQRRIEIYARFLSDQRVYLAPIDDSVTVRAGRLVLTEISRKFVLGELRDRLAEFGLTVQHTYTDEREWFALLLLQRACHPVS